MNYSCHLPQTTPGGYSIKWQHSRCKILLTGLILPMIILQLPGCDLLRSSPATSQNDGDQTLQDAAGIVWTLNRWSSADETYYYESNYLEPVTNTLMTANRWRLDSSTDPDIDNFEGNMVPELTLKDDRQFTIEWYWDADDSVFDSYRINGYWGISGDHAFLFYRTGGRGGGAGQSSVMRRLLDVSAYTIDDHMLILIDQESDETHRFQPIEEENRSSKARHSPDSNDDNRNQEWM